MTKITRKKRIQKKGKKLFVKDKNRQIPLSSVRQIDDLKKLNFKIDTRR